MCVCVCVCVFCFLICTVKLLGDKISRRISNTRWAWTVWRSSKVSHFLTTLSVCLRFQYTVCLSFSVHSYAWYAFLSSYQYMVRLCFLAHSSKRYICLSAHSSICCLVFLCMASTRGTKQFNISVVASLCWIIFR